MNSPSGQADATGRWMPEGLSARRLRSRLLVVAGLVVAVIAIVVLLPGLDGLRSHFRHARPGWLALAGAFKVLSALSYVVVFRAVFCRRMNWRVSYQIGIAELGANALVPTAGAGGLALGAWALRRGGMSANHIARRTVAFFLLTSVANVGAVIVVGVGLAVRVLPGDVNLALCLVPAALAGGAILATLAAGRLAGTLRARVARHPGGGESRRLRILDAVAEGVRESLVLLRRGDARLIAGSVGYLAFDIMALWAAFHAFGPTPHLAIIWIAYLLGELGGLLPIPGGLGGVDAGLVGTLALYGISVTLATAAVLAYRALALWIPALMGALAFVALQRTLRGERHQIALCAPGEEVHVVGLGPVVVRPQGPGQVQ
ncbi:MAG: hypothetical protein NVSMB25_01980 [Thermoleophilaceae bacterium]